jgi:hypothetical protein
LSAAEFAIEMVKFSSNFHHFWVTIGPACLRISMPDSIASVAAVILYGMCNRTFEFAPTFAQCPVIKGFRALEQVVAT